MKFILKLKSIFTVVTKETINALKIMILGFIFITAIIITKYKPVYEVKVGNEILGYVKDQNAFKEEIQKQIIEKQGQNIENVSLLEEPQYEAKLINRKNTTDENEILTKLEESSITTYKYYAVTLNNKTQSYVDTIEQAEEVVEKIKSEHSGDDIKLDLAVNEMYTENIEELKTEQPEKIELSMEEEINQLLKEEEAKKAIATINGINVSVLPVSGTISSRFGVRSSIRSGAHTGLDIACSSGTNIKAVAEGTVVFAQMNGAYGNLIKIDHGNNVETWYAHCSKIIAKAGQKIKAGDIIGKVGSTGNSTGPHLHLEIRINGTAVNPQKYLYK